MQVTMHFLNWRMHRLIAAGLLPERVGQPVKAIVHVSLAELRAMDGDSVLQQQWVTVVQAQWAAHRAGASAGGSGTTTAWNKDRTKILHSHSPPARAG
jgi:hypothetical protein